MASLVYLVLYLYLHACSARPVTVSDKARLSNKDGKTSIHGSNLLKLRNQKPSSVKEDEGKLVSVSYSWKISHQEKLKRVERSTLEAPLSSCNCSAEETVRSKDTDRVEDVAVMDYVQPRRKPPIHNHGT